MSKARYGYGWLLKWILAAILLAVGLTVLFNKEIVFFITGVILVIFSIFRVVPLLKSLNKEVLRTLNLIEVIFGVILGVIMIYVGVNALKNDGEITSTLSLVYKYTLVFVLAFRAIIFLYSVTFLEEKTEQPKFWFHLALFAAASMIVVLKDFDETWVAYLLLIISIAGSAYLGYDGFGGYKKYREYSKALNDGKVKTKQVEKELPETNQPIVEKEEDERPYIS
ncbi:MAG: hypothetical protein RBQ97_06650 [Acholeplasma sp.]|nr:hypothetical protein [Acholeplasma sp.]